MSLEEAKKREFLEGVSRKDTPIDTTTIIVIYAKDLKALRFTPVPSSTTGG
jgi:hypothetical protein